MRELATVTSGSQEAGVTQPRDHLIADPCTLLHPVVERVFSIAGGEFSGFGENSSKSAKGRGRVQTIRRHGKMEPDMQLCEMEKQCVLYNLYFT